MLHSICQQIWKTQQWPQDWKRTVFIPIPKKGKAKNCSNYHTIALISHTSKVMLKILQARIQQYMNHELPDVQADFRKVRGTRDQIANICWIIEKAREFQRNIYFCFLDYAKPLTVWITINCGKFWKRWEYQTTWPASWEICMHVRKCRGPAPVDPGWFEGGRGVGVLEKTFNYRYRGRLEMDSVVGRLVEKKRLFSSSSLFAIRVVSSAYLRWLIFLPAILIPACASSTQRFSWCTLHRS